MKLDIHPAVVTLVILTVLGALAGLWGGVRAIRSARRGPFFRIRRQRVSGGWRLVFLSLALAVLAVVLALFGEPVAYRYFPPSPTLTKTPTITLTFTISLTPTITETPTITLTPAESYTPTITPTPFIPPEVMAQFTSSVTPDPKAVFSPLVFSRSISNYQAVNPATVFQNPINRIYATFSFDSRQKVLNGRRCGTGTASSFFSRADPGRLAAGGMDIRSGRRLRTNGWPGLTRCRSSSGQNGRLWANSSSRVRRPR